MKFKKLAKCSLATALILGSVGAISGCKKDNDNNTTEKTEQEKTYDLYVQYMNAKGDAPLTYEQWLVSIKGKDGISPKVRINETTNYWEISTDNGVTWTSTGVKATGAEGEKGDSGDDAIAPQVRINQDTNYWEISTDNGTTWTSTGVKATGAEGEKGDPGDDAIAPQVRINQDTNYWEISTDNGATWISTGVKATGNDGLDTSYVEYTISFDYKGFDLLFEEVIEETTVLSVQWIKNMPKVKSIFNESFLGWFIKGTNKQINDFDFIGENIELEARFNKLYNEIVNEKLYIRLVNGNPNQTLGMESPLTYEMIIDSDIFREFGPETFVEWYLDENKVCEIVLEEDRNWCTFTPQNLTIGEHMIYVKINDIVSLNLNITVHNNLSPVISLVGDEVMYLEVGGPQYIEIGATAMDNVDGDISDEIIVTGNVNVNEIGTYYIYYDVEDSFGNVATRMTRMVIVRDTTAPLITLKGEREVILNYGQTYVEQGATAIDNYDGEVEVIINDSQLKNEPGTYEIYYTARDESGNISNQVIRYVTIIDRTSPEITLIGDEIIYLEVGGSPYVEEGARAIDAEEGDISNKIVITGSVNINETGTYYIYYDVEDDVGNIATRKTRTVIVRDTTKPVVVLNGPSEMILTYGDTYEELGALVADNYDKNLQVTINSDALKTEPGMYEIYYTATDSSGNVSQIVTRRVIVRPKTIKIKPTVMSKIYGYSDPMEYIYEVEGELVGNDKIIGKLSREPGENVGSYRITIGSLDINSNYEIVLDNAYFRIIPRVIEVRANNLEKIYGESDPIEYTYEVNGELVGNDKIIGKLSREPGETVGDYQITLGTLSISNNYNIRYTSAIFSIKYAEFTEITIYSLTNNEHQIEGEESEVRLYARFNEGADDSEIGDVVWKIVKNDEIECQFTKDNNTNIISFLPEGSVGTYIISASYKGITANYEVYVGLQ